MIYAGRLLILVAALSAALLVACDGDELSKPEKPRGWTVITWVQETPEVCGNVRGSFNGCASISQDGRNCTITMPENAADYVIAHEFKHCMGYVHKDGHYP